MLFRSSRIPTDLEKSWSNIIKEISHEKYLKLDKKRILSDLSVRRVLKKIHPNLHIKKKAFDYLVILIQNISDSLAEHAINHTKLDRLKTISSRDIQSAIRLSIPLNLSKHVVSEATKAVTKYTSS